MRRSPETALKVLPCGILGCHRACENLGPEPGGHRLHSLGIRLGYGLTPKDLSSLASRPQAILATWHRGGMAGVQALADDSDLSGLDHGPDRDADDVHAGREGRGVEIRRVPACSVRPVCQNCHLPSEGVVDSGPDDAVLGQTERDDSPS